MPSNRALYVDLSLIYKTVLYILWSVIFTNIQCCEVLQKLTNPLYWQGTFAILSLFSYLIFIKSQINYCWLLQIWIFCNSWLFINITMYNYFFLYSWFTCKVLIKIIFLHAYFWLYPKPSRQNNFLFKIITVCTNILHNFFLIIKQTLIFNYK